MCQPAPRLLSVGRQRFACRDLQALGHIYNLRKSYSVPSQALHWMDRPVPSGKPKPPVGSEMMAGRSGVRLSSHSPCPATTFVFDIPHSSQVFVGLLPFSAIFLVSIFPSDIAGSSSSSQTHWPVDCKFSILNPRGLTVYLVYLDISSRSKTLRMLVFQSIVCFECDRPTLIVVWQYLAFHRFLRLWGCHLASVLGGLDMVVF